MYVCMFECVCVCDVFEPLVLMHDVRVEQACAPRTHSSVSVCMYACMYGV